MEAMILNLQAKLLDVEKEEATMHAKYMLEVEQKHKALQALNYLLKYPLPRPLHRSLPENCPKESRKAKR
jgi:hypothetical protein